MVEVKTGDHDGLQTNGRLHYSLRPRMVCGHFSNIGDDEENCFIAFYINRYSDIFQSGNVKGRYLLDVGTGPTIHSIISASRHVDEIYLSDFAPQNRAILIDWWKGNDIIQDKITEYILKKENRNESVLDKQIMMKSKVRGVFQIDVTLPDPICSESHVKEFDVVTSSFCMEAVARSDEEYRHNAKNLSSLLKTGGHLIINGISKGTYFRVGEFRFNSFSPTANRLQEIYKECGFMIMNFYEKETGEEMGAGYHNCTMFYVMHAKKVR